MLELMKMMKNLKTGPSFWRKGDAPVPILFQPMRNMCASQPRVVVIPKGMNYIQLVFHCITGASLVGLVSRLGYLS